MITRTYNPISECTELFVQECFDKIPLDLLAGPYDAYDDWEFRGFVEPGEFDPEDPMVGEGLRLHPDR